MEHIYVGLILVSCIINVYGQRMRENEPFETFQYGGQYPTDTGNRLTNTNLYNRDLHFGRGWQSHKFQNLYGYLYDQPMSGLDRRGNVQSHPRMIPYAEEGNPELSHHPNLHRIQPLVMRDVQHTEDGNLELAHHHLLHQRHHDQPLSGLNREREEQHTEDDNVNLSLHPHGRQDYDQSMSGMAREVQHYPHTANRNVQRHYPHHRQHMHGHSNKIEHDRELHHFGKPNGYYFKKMEVSPKSENTLLRYDHNYPEKRG